MQLTAYAVDDEQGHLPRNLRVGERHHENARQQRAVVGMRPSDLCFEARQCSARSTVNTLKHEMKLAGAQTSTDAAFQFAQRHGIIARAVPIGLFNARGPCTERSSERGRLFMVESEHGGNANS